MLPLLINTSSVTCGDTFLEQSKVNFALGHRKRVAYAFAHLVPKKRYQSFLPCMAGSGNSSSRGRQEARMNCRAWLAFTVDNPSVVRLVSLRVHDSSLYTRAPRGCGRKCRGGGSPPDECGQSRTSCPTLLCRVKSVDNAF